MKLRITMGMAHLLLVFRDHQMEQCYYRSFWYTPRRLKLVLRSTSLFSIDQLMGDVVVLRRLTTQRGS